MQSAEPSSFRIADSSNELSTEATRLAALARGGDQGALDDLGKSLNKLISRWACSMLNGVWGDRRRQIKEEMLSYSGVALMQAVRHYRVETGHPFLRYFKAILFRAWLRKVMRPIMGKERGSARNPYLFDDLPVGLGNPDNLLSGEVEFLGRERTSRAAIAVQDILNKMEKEQADLLKMVYGIGEGNDEPRRVVDLEREAGLGRNVLHQRLRQARNRFRELFVAGS